LGKRNKAARALSAVLRFIHRKPLGAAGGLLVILLVLVSTFASVLAPYDPYEHNTAISMSPPTSQNLAGTDVFGRDQLSRIIFGARISLYVGLLSVVLGTSVGLVIGVTSAYFGGKFDLLVQRLVDTMMGFPGLVLVLVLVIALGPSLFNVTLAIAINYSDKVVRLTRSSALSVKEEVYVLAAGAIGAGNLRIITRHIIPNSLAPLFVLATGQLGSAIVTEASLSFLGLGVQPPHPSWGNMLQAASKAHLETAAWLAIYPGLALAAVTFAFAVFGDAMRDVLDPRLRGS
jgi:peptide/nickel transport system permease protein